jgi:hypothetical protein
MSNLSKIHKFVEIVSDDMLHRTVVKTYIAMDGIARIQYIDYGFFNERQRNMIDYGFNPDEVVLTYIRTQYDLEDEELISAIKSVYDVKFEKKIDQSKCALFEEMLV